MEEMRNEEIRSLKGCEPKELAEAIAEILDNKKGNNVKVIAVGDKTVIADYFVLATGNTNTHVRALADEVEFKIGEMGVDPLRHEGRQGNSWRVLDYASVIVHVFDREARDFYKLDKLYTDFE
jgi:ribosome-associated protein